jgi:hypothetical protein
MMKTHIVESRTGMLGIPTVGSFVFIAHSILDLN